MVSRRTRSYKDKRPAGVFGQFMLPFAVVMAIALLYFSIKLFFLSGGSNKREDSAGGQAVVPVQTRPAVQPAPAEQPQSQTPAQVQPQTVAGPVGTWATHTPHAATTTTKPTAAQSTPSSVSSTEPKTAQTIPPAASTAKPLPLSIRRYDVQIGAFSSRDNAVQLVQKVRAQGYEVYVNEPEQEGPPYRVRVKGTVERQRAESLSAKLKELGYPIYIIAIN